MEIVYPVEPIVPAKNVNALRVDNCGVAISCAGRVRRAIGRQFFPRVRLEVEAIEVIAAVSAVVPTKNVEVVVKGDACV